MTEEKLKNNKIEYLGKYMEEEDGISRETGFSIFKNHDEELVKKIKAVNLAGDNTFESPMKGTCTIESEIGDQYQCIDPKGKRFFIDKTDLVDYRKEELLNKINTLYPVYNYWNQQFGSIFGKETITIIGNDEGGYNDLGKVGYCKTPFELMVSEYGISMSKRSSQWSSVMFCYFNEDGNYVNRDYNLKIQELADRTNQTSTEILQAIEKNIPDVVYQYADDKWFTDEFAFCFKDLSIKESTEKSDFSIEEDEEENVIGFSLSREAARKNGIYGNKGNKNTFKKPKNTIQADKKSILERITPIVNNFGLQE